MLTTKNNNKIKAEIVKIENLSFKRDVRVKLMDARLLLSQTSLTKSGYNPSKNIRYYELKDILPPILTIFRDLQLFSNFSVVGDLAILEITDLETNTSEKFTSSVMIGEVKGCTATQNIGAMHTYMRRYLYMNALEIVETSSDESRNTGTIIYFNNLKHQIRNKADLKTLKQFVLEQTDSIKARLNEKQKDVLRSCIHERKNQLLI